MLKLVISDDEGKTTVVPLVRDELTIGRNEGNTIRLTERNVSRRHARLYRQNGSFMIEDLGSYNGVRVNGRRLDGNAEIEAGDRLQIGDYQLALQPSTVRPSAPPRLPAGGAPARLVMVGDPAPGAEFTLSKSVLRIGRDEQLDIWIDHTSISREHAEIRVADGKVTLFDLDSANGVRVNGVDTTRRELQSSDVVELGEVQFRFMAGGAAYSADDTLLDTETVVSRSPSKKPPVVALASLGAIVGAAALTMVFMLQESPAPELGVEVTSVGAPASAPPAQNAPEPNVEAEAPAPSEEAPPAGQDIAVAAALEACERALEQGRWTDASRYAARATSLVPDDARAADCLARAQVGLGHKARLEEALRVYQSGQVDEAFAIVTQLPEGSPLRSTAGFRRVRDGYVEAQLSAARRALGRDQEEATRLAELVLELPEANAGQRKDARKVVARARRQASNARAASARASRKQSTARQPTPHEPTPEPAATQTTAAAKPKPEPTAPASGGLDAARACLRQGDNQCVIRALENGQARTPAALALLIETYRSTGNPSAAQRHMRTFVRRYPSDRRATRYEQILNNQ